MTFGRPYLLLFLLLLPLLAWLKGRKGDPPAFLYSSVQLVQGLLNVSRSRVGQFLATLRWLALGLLLLALAQPRFTKSETKVTASGVDIIIAIDMSGSMRAEDFEIGRDRANRLAKAQQVLRGFIEKRPNDRIGLVAFASEAFIAAPLTLDHEFLLKNLERLELGLIDENRTAIGSGLATAVNRLRDLPAKTKLVILMTDGQNNSGQVDPINAAKAAQALGVKVYTIGVGTRGTAPVPVYMGGRKVGYQPQAVDIDEDTLQKIASLTKGKYYRADNSAKFEAIYKEIDQLEKTEAQIRKYAQHRELAPWVIGLGLSLLLLEVVLGQTIWRRLP